jgi:hypothetical protein
MPRSGESNLTIGRHSHHDRAEKITIQSLRGDCVFSPDDEIFRSGRVVFLRSDEPLCSRFPQPSMRVAEILSSR